MWGPDLSGTPDLPYGISMKMGRRYKTYSGETGVTYQYFFESRRRVVRPEGQGPGTDFIFVVIADQYAPLTVRVFVADRALSSWLATHSRGLDATEQYAAAKMRLFRAFDEEERLGVASLTLLVDEKNIEEILQTLDLG
jgi:hypothetical protein